MKYGMRVRQSEGVPRDVFARMVAQYVEHTIMETTDAEEFAISLVELRDGEVV